MRTSRKLLVALAPIALLACKVGTDPYVPLSVTGTVTQAGQPAPALLQLTAGGNLYARLFEDGTYDITTTGGGVAASFCSQAKIQARLVAADLQTVIAEQSRDLGGCGEFVVDFAFP